ncbi:MAG TPA: hypothetical protein VFC63_07330 [Blastocatellia bacterium]|nr:hypothetical protein [Blastocatellia bacterium]
MRRLSLHSVIISLCLGLLLSLTLSAKQQGQGGDGQAANQPPVKLPENLRMRVELLSSITTKDNKEGDKFTAHVMEPNDFKDAIVEGHIAKIKPAAHAGGSSELSLAFDTITLNNGTGAQGKMQAQIEEVYDVVDAGGVDNEGHVKAKSVKKRNAVKIGGGAGAGALIGGLIGGGKGAAIGAGVGAAVGTTTVLAGKGKDMEFPTGTQLVIRTGGKGK